MEVSEYESLVPSFNRGQQKFMAFLRAVLTQAVDIGNVSSRIQEAFRLDDAVGVQLDVLGHLVGAERYLPFQPKSQSRVLSDEDYRLFIRSTIANNMWDGTNETVIVLFATIFPSMGIYVQDMQGMEMRVTLRGSFSDIQLEMINQGFLIPHPAGVTVKYYLPHQIDATSLSVRAGIYLQGEMEFASINV